MGSLNVNRSVSDQFYRYKMPRLIAKVEGKGNGIKTVIVNMVDIAKSLQRPATYPTKYFGCELGAQTQFDFKNDRYIVNGSHDAPKLQDLLDGFIKKFVLCPECDNPETHLIVHQKKQTITQHCIACGYQGPIDMRHKLTTFIVKNPPAKFTYVGQNPNVVGASITTPKDKDKEKHKSKRKTKEDSKDADNSPPPETETVRNEDDDDDWAVDTSEDAVAKRMEALTDGAKVITLNDDLEKTQQERLDIFYNFVKVKRKAEGKLDGCDKEFAAEADRLDIKDKSVLVLSELLFNENMKDQIKQYRILLLRFTHGNHKAQKYLLGGFELLVKMHSDSLMAKVPHILKTFYDSDILEEEIILDWARKISKKYVSKELSQEIHDKAAVFIKWLEEAEEEESSSGDEEEDVEVVYSDRPQQTVKNQGSKSIVSGSKNAEDGEDDLDIDAI
uniref:Eukaryotic translation initiation factor 5 n=1 Tax=Strigamia maritima TaxID=126957 RepID=T1IQQ0_STRMM